MNSPVRERSAESQNSNKVAYLDARQVPRERPDTGYERLVQHEQAQERDLKVAS
jgi:hypothetical protein